MKKGINHEYLECLKAIRTIRHFRLKHDGMRSDSFDYIAELLDAVIGVAEKTHHCPNCGEIIELYVIRK